MNYTALCAEDGKLILLLHPLANLVTSISTLQMENFALIFCVCLLSTFGKTISFLFFLTAWLVRVFFRKNNIIDFLILSVKSNP